MMEKKLFDWDGIPCVLYGEATDQIYLYVHGQFGSKFEAESFAENAVPEGWQVLAFDLPEHGGRTDGARLVPWDVCRELQLLMQHLEAGWKYIGVRATSIGAWFAMQAFPGKFFSKAMFVSPLLDMPAVIQSRMDAAGVSAEQLEREGTVQTESGELSWAYREWALSHPLTPFHASTEVLYPGLDPLTPRATTERICKEYRWGQAVMENGEHWFHTPEQLEFLSSWEQAVLFTPICKGRGTFRSI